MNACHMKGCTDEVLHKLEWRIRGPVIEGGPRDRISGGTGNLAYACGKHLEEIKALAATLSVGEDQGFSTEQCDRWVAHLSTLAVLPYDPDVLLSDDLTRAEAKQVLKVALAAQVKLNAFVNLFDSRANPATLS